MRLLRLRQLADPPNDSGIILIPSSLWAQRSNLKIHLELN
jgi:hypothetical protein